MSILSAHNLGLSYGADDIFSGLSLELPNDAKVGLVGPNGVGKSSLFRIIAGHSPPTTGSVHVVRGTRIGYLRQEAVEAFAGHDHSVHDEMLTVFADLRSRADDLRAMEERMANGHASGDLLEAYGAALEAFEHDGGYEYESRIKHVLAGLGFPPDTWGTAIQHLSGGQKTRALLARLLLERPSLLMLDEPTNHLDLEAIEWLEKTLRTWEGALLIASHDRYFLDRVVDRIWEMSPHHIERYRGNYTAYLHQRQERWERNQQVFESEMERLRKELELIRRYHAWRKFEEAWGKLKRLTRELLAIERYGLLEIQGKQWSELEMQRARMMTIEEAHEAIKRIKRPPGRPPRLHMRLKSTRRSGQIVLRTKGLQVGYDGEPLLACDDIHLERLERVALIGPNGSGKTSFLHTVRGELDPVAGEVMLGAGLQIGYFAQAHDSLDRESTVLDELLHHRNLPIPEARNYLAQYLFRGDDVYKPVGALSGGERGRLALAVLALEGVNFLLLDEPTNHLDIAAREVLQEGLERFEGTMILVSHDRYLVAELATQIWELRDGRLHVFDGTYEEFVEARERAQTVVATERRATVVDRREQVQAERDERRRLQRVAALEAQIARTEDTVAGLGRKVSACADDGDLDGVIRISGEQTEVQRELDGLLEQWAALSTDQPGDARLASGQ